MVTLIEAAKTGNLPQVYRILLKGRTDINCRDSEKKGTPLFWAANGGHDQIVAMLLGNGADKEIPVKFGMTPLMAAVDRKYYTSAKLLLEQGANVNAQSQSGDTALHLAAYRGYSSLCKLLIHYGASRDFLNNNGKTPQQGAESAGHMNLVKLLAPESSHKAVCRSSSYPSAHQSPNPTQGRWKEPRVASEIDDSPFIDDEEEWSSIHKKLSKPPLQHPISMAVRRDGEVARYFSAQNLDKVGQVSPPTNMQGIPHRRSPHLMEDSVRPARRSSDPQMQRDHRGKTPAHYVAGAHVIQDGREYRRWSPPTTWQRNDSPPEGLYGFLPQKDGHWELLETSGNGLTCETPRPKPKVTQKPHSAPGSFRRDANARIGELLGNGEDFPYRLSPDTQRSSQELENYYQAKLEAPRRCIDDQTLHQGVIAGSAMANAGHSGVGSHVRWNADHSYRKRNGERHAQGSVIRNSSEISDGENQRLSPILGSADVGYGQRPHLANNQQTSGNSAVSDADDLKVRHLHSVIDRLLAEKLSLTEQNEVMGERLKRLELALDTLLSADSSSEESLQTSHQESSGRGPRHTVHVTRKLDSSLDRSLRLEQLCLKLLHDNQRLQALSTVPLEVVRHVMNSQDSTGHRNSHFHGKQQSTACQNSALRPPNEPIYLSESSPSNRSTSSSSLSPASDSSLYDSGSGPDHPGALSRTLSDNKNHVPPVVPDSGAGFIKKCWQCMNSSYPRQAFSRENIGNPLVSGRETNSASRTRTGNVKSILKAMDVINSDTRGQHSIDCDQTQLGPINVDIAEKLSQKCMADGSISAQFKCVKNGKNFLLKVNNLQHSKQDKDSVEMTVSQYPHLHLPIHHWKTSLTDEDAFSQQLQMKLQADLPPTKEMCHTHSSGKHVDEAQDAGYYRSKETFQCRLYPPVTATLRDMFVSGMRNGEATPSWCSDTGITRILLQLLLAVECLHKEDVAHGNIHPEFVYLTQDMRIVLGGLEDARSINQRGNSVPLLKPAHELSEVNLGQSSDVTADIFAIASMLCKLLDSTHTPGKDQQITSPPDWLSTTLRNLLTEMLSPDPEERPSVNSAILRLAFILYGPMSDEVNSVEDCEEWLVTQALRLIVTAPQEISFSQEEERDCAELLSHLDWGLSKDFILRATPEELWQLCQKSKKI